ncbi:MAG: TolC family protein [Marinilabiliaceae bacterium]|nr:TolC family protein [Marinilabiliaceae bacterium]
MRQSIKSLRGGIAAFVLLFTAHTVLGQENQLLNHYRRMALDYDQQVKAAELNKQAAAANTKAVASDYKPKLSVGANYTWVQNPMELTLPLGDKPMSFTGMNESYGLQASLLQPVYAGGAIRHKHAMRKQEEMVAWGESDRVKSDIVYNLDLLYWRTVGQQEVVDIFESYHQSIERLVTVVGARVKTGTVSRNDLLMVEVKQNEVLYLWEEAKTNFQVSRMAMNQQVGQAVDAVSPIDPEIPALDAMEVPENWLSVVLTSRPELRIARANVEKQQTIEKLTLSPYNPQVYAGLNGTYGAPGYNFNNDMVENMNVGVSVSMPIFEWSKRKHEKTAARLHTGMQEQMLSRVSDKVTLEAQAGYYSLKQAIQQVNLSHSSLAKAQENARMMENRYKEGIVSVIEVLDAQIYLQNARINYTQARMKACISESSFYKAIGILVGEVEMNSK